MATEVLPRSQQQPDIAYAPDWDKYQARTARRLATEQLETTLPAGFPVQLEGELVWDGDGLAETYNWTYVLSEQQLEEIERALQHFKSLDLPLSRIGQATFPLPTLHAELRRLSRELHEGHGFFVLRGLDPTRHSRTDNIALFAGVSAHVAPIRGRQDHRTHDGSGRPVAAAVVLNHITDLRGTAAGSRIGAPAYTADPQVFHTDSGDVVALFALETAAEGGASRLASAARVYNELAANRPDLVRTLSEGWIADRVSAHNNTNNPPTPTPTPLLIHLPAAQEKVEDGSSSSRSSKTSPSQRIVLQYARRTFTGFGALPRNPAVPAITEAQAEALDAMHFLGERFGLRLDFRRGDVQYVNNLAVFHARDGFVDRGERRRHLVRLWLRDPEYAWETPEAWRERWEGVYGTDLAGDFGAGVEEVLPLEPYVRGAADGGMRKTA